MSLMPSRGSSWPHDTVHLSVLKLFKMHFNIITSLSLPCPNGVFLYDLAAACSSWPPGNGYPSVLNLYKMRFNIFISMRLRCPNGVFLYDFAAACSSWPPDTVHPSDLNLYKIYCNVISLYFPKVSFCTIFQLIVLYHKLLNVPSAKTYR